MIVLAIAGLILAVVFIAVPALQRNQRNSARRNDVAYVKAQLNQLVANRGNRIPAANENTQIAGILQDDELNYLGSADNTGRPTVTPKAHGDAIAIGDAQTILWYAAEPTGTTALNVGTDILVLVRGESCGGNNILSNANTANIAGLVEANRNIAIIYTLEEDTNVYCEDTTL